MPSTARAAVYPLLMLAAVVTLTTCAGANTTPRTPTHGHILPTADLSGRKLLTIDKIHDAISNVVQAKVDAVQDLLNSNKVNLVNNPAPATSATAGAFAAVQATAVAPPPPTQPTSASAFAAASATATAPTPNLPKPPVPAPCKTVYQTAQSVPELSTLVALVQAAGLVSELNDTNLVATVFAPTNAAINAAIAALGTSQADVLRNRELLRQILLTHIVPGAALLSTDLKDNQVLRAQSGVSLTIDLGAGGLVVVKAPGSSAKVIQANIKACVAVVHIIEFVLLPTAPPAPSVVPKAAPKAAPAPAPAKAATPPAIARAGAEAVAVTAG